MNYVQVEEDKVTISALNHREDPKSKRRPSTLFTHKAESNVESSWRHSTEICHKGSSQIADNCFQKIPVSSGFVGP